jgi:hypothetical protein
MCCIIVVSYISEPELTLCISTPGYLSASAGLKFADIPPFLAFLGPPGCQLPWEPFALSWPPVQPNSARPQAVAVAAASDAAAAAVS